MEDAALLANIYNNMAAIKARFQLVLSDVRELKTNHEGNRDVTDQLGSYINELQKGMAIANLFTPIFDNLRKNPEVLNEDDEDLDETLSKMNDYMHN